MDLYNSVRISFFINGAGEVEKELSNTTVDLNHTLKFKEFLFLAFVIWETYYSWKVLKGEWDFISTELEEPSTIRPDDNMIIRVAKRCGIAP